MQEFKKEVFGVIIESNGQQVHITEGADMIVLGDVEEARAIIEALQRAIFQVEDNHTDNYDYYDDDEDTDVTTTITSSIYIPQAYMTIRKETYLRYMLEREHIVCRTAASGNFVIDILSHNEESWEYLSEKVQDVLLAANYIVIPEKGTGTVVALRSVDEGFVNREIQVKTLVTRETRRKNGNNEQYIPYISPAARGDNDVYGYTCTVDGICTEYRVRVSSCGIMYRAD